MTLCRAGLVFGGWSVEKEAGRCAAGWPTPCPDRSSEDARSPGPSEKRASNMQNRPANAGQQPATAFRSLVARQLRSGVLMFSGVES